MSNGPEEIFKDAIRRAFVDYLTHSKHNVPEALKRAEDIALSYFSGLADPPEKVDFSSRTITLGEETMRFGAIHSEKPTITYFSSPAINTYPWPFDGDGREPPSEDVKKPSLNDIEESVPGGATANGF